MVTEKPVIWTDRLCAGSVPAILGLASGAEGIDVKCLKCGEKAEGILKAAAKILRKKVSVERIDPYLGDIRLDGQSAGMKFQFDLPEMSKTIAENLKKGPAYGRIVRRLPAENLDLFIEMKVSEEIYYHLKVFLLAESRLHSMPGSRNIFLACSSAITRQLAGIFAGRGIDTRLYRNAYDLRFAAGMIIKSAAKKHLFFKELSTDTDFKKSENPVVAVHYAEGLDTGKRSDIFWMKGSPLEGRKALFYIDMNKSSRLPVGNDECSSIRAMGASWISLNDSAISGDTKRKRLKGLKPRSGILGFLCRAIGAGSWYTATALSLYTEMKSWEEFYRYFNIKAVIDMGGQMSSGIAQNAALKRVGGLRLGAQRSSLTYDSNLPYLIYNGNDIFFIWGELTSMHRGTSRIIREFVISGYPFDNSFEGAFGEAAAVNAGFKGKFVIALFDNVYSKELQYSQQSVKEFYNALLGWLIEDDEVVVVAKEKKEGYLERIEGLGDTIQKAAATGRFVRIENPLGKLPVSISKNANISVGLGVSSAVIEAAIAGGAGVHCDIAGHYFHPYYKWGKDSLIFSDMDKLISSLKQYKRDPGSNGRIGDWSEYVGRIDPFRDGRAGERIGYYIKLVLEAFEKGEGRDRAISYANGSYAAKWGADKVIKTRYTYEAA
ncbi:MAG: hypothetical protein WC512_05890 [Candidatus Omnitrophota bacterium]